GLHQRQQHSGSLLPRSTHKKSSFPFLHHCPKKCHFTGRLFDNTFQTCLNDRSVDPPASHHFEKGRPHELLKRDHCGYRISGESEDKFFLRYSKKQRLSGFHRDLPENLADSDLLEGLLHKIAIAHRDATRYKKD